MRRISAVLIALCTLWLVSVTAGSETFQSAAESVRSRAAALALRWELVGFPPEAGLSPAAELTLAQSPLLLSAKAQVLPLQDAGAPPPEEPSSPPAAQEDREESVSTPVEETPLEVLPQPEDNGVPARTLVPTDPTGYTVCGKVYISTTTSYELSASALQEPFDAVLTGQSPQILILHTHGSESYTPAQDQEDIVWSGEYRTTDSRYNVVKVGDEMAAAFGAKGISVLHDRTLYDYPSYSGAYDRSLAAIQSYLAQYPSIRFVLDVHRDAVADGDGNQYKVISPIEGMGAAAQMSLIMGSDQSGLDHPLWRENLKLAVAIQQRILTDYPTLMRPLSLRKSRYNQHATTGSLLVEVGAAGNSPQEAALAGRLFALEMSEVLLDQVK